MTEVRQATLADCVHVLSAMQHTPRGQEELAQARNIMGFAPDAEKIAMLHFEASVGAFSFADGEDVLAVAGFIIQRPGVCRTWMFARDEAWERYGAELTERVRMMLDSTMDVSHRIEAVCSDSRLKVHRWYDRIGLQKETTLTRYMADGSNAALFVRIRGDN